MVQIHMVEEERKYYEMNKENIIEECIYDLDISEMYTKEKCMHS